MRLEEIADGLADDLIRVFRPAQRKRAGIGKHANVGCVDDKDAVRRQFDHLFVAPLGFLQRRQGILGSAAYKIDANWVISGAARYDLNANKVSQTQVGIGYVDDCFILALNYITDYTYSGNATADHRIMFQIGLRTLGGTSVSQGVSP